MNDKKMERKGLLGIDIDGTLITDTGHISDAVYNALEKAVNAGWEFVIASGRTYYAAKTVIERLPFLRYAILSNGSCIIDVKDSSIVRMKTLAPPLVEKVIEVTRRNGAIPALYSTDILNQTVY